MMNPFASSLLLVEFNPSAVDAYGLVITLVGYLIVFLALVTLYLVFRYLVPRILDFNLKRLFRKRYGQEPPRDLPEISGEVNAAIAAALFMYFEEIHDPESDVITIRRVSKPYSPWSSKIYGVGHLR